MKIKWLGHSCFFLTADSGTTLLTDPYDTGAYPDTLLYRSLDEPPGISPNVVTISHGHADHGNVDALSGMPEIVLSPQPRRAAGFSIRGVKVFHDAEHGAVRGDNIIFIIEADGVTVCHLGDLGHELTPEQAGETGSPDVLLIPVGGKLTIGAAEATRVWQQLSPSITIPMHYRNDKCLFRIDGYENFTAGKPGVELSASSEIELVKEKLPSSPKIIVLESAN